MIFVWRESRGTWFICKNSTASRNGNYTSRCHCLLPLSLLWVTRIIKIKILRAPPVLLNVDNVYSLILSMQIFGWVRIQLIRRQQLEWDITSYYGRMNRCVWWGKRSILLVNKGRLLLYNFLSFWARIHNFLAITFHKNWLVMKRWLRGSETISNQWRYRFVQCLNTKCRWYLMFRGSLHWLLMQNWLLRIERSGLYVQPHLFLFDIVDLFIISIVLHDFLVHLRHWLLLNGRFYRFSWSLSSFVHRRTYRHGKLHRAVGALV
jgi:hypothetical protein